MSDHEHEEEEDDGIPVIPVSLPSPEPIHYDSVETETTMASSWMEAARAADLIPEGATVSTESVAAIMDNAHRKDLVPGDMNDNEALTIFVWWFAFHAGYQFHDHANQIMAAQAMMGVASHILGLDNINPFLEDEEEGEDENPERDSD